MKLRRPSPALVVSLIALFVALSGAGYAATGGNFILGRANTANAQTSLTATNAGKALQITQQSTGVGATALGLNVPAGKPPFTTNSTTKVGNLNADKLDGMEPWQLNPSSGGISTTDVALDPFTRRSVVRLALTTSVTSVILANGAVEIDDRDATGPDRPYCAIRFDGTTDTQFFETAVPAPTAGVLGVASLAVAGSQAVAAGSHSVEIVCATNSGNTVVDNAGLNISAHPIQP